jgi:hypothetical protein
MRLLNDEQYAQTVDALENAETDCYKPVSTQCRDALAMLRAMKPVELCAIVNSMDGNTCTTHLRKYPDGMTPLFAAEEA